MEIISYLDNHKTSFRSQARFVSRTANRSRRNSGYSTRYAASVSLQKPTEAFQEFMGNTISKAKATYWFIARRFLRILLLLTTIPAGVLLSSLLLQVHRHLEYFAPPVEFAYLSPDELKVLDEAMARFALMNADAIDSAGNILLDQETAAIPISFRQPVTYTTYSVKGGDTISAITYKSGLTNISTLIAVNDIGNVRQLRAGQKLKIPSIDGLIHGVRDGESLEGLSAKYKVAVEDILDVNDLSSAMLSPGQQLFIPGAKLDHTTLQRAMGELFVWPISSGYRISSYFGYRLDPFTGVPSSHTGIDLAIAEGTPIKAAMSGKIVAVGYTNVYGNYVIIDHENGYQTLYAHLYKPAPVKKGQRVAQGTRIGAVGNTGYSTGPHLHFTVYKNGKLIDPMTVLKN